MRYGIISDMHYNNWRQFSTTLPNRLNSRLQISLDQTLMAAVDVKNKGGEALFIAGDMFHVRGNVAPSVLNPVIELYRRIIWEHDLKIYIIPGNHDLESEDSHAMMSASSPISRLGATICHSAGYFDGVIMVPWIKKLDVLKNILQRLGSEHPGTDLIIHAPVNGAVFGIPDTGLDAGWLGGLGFERVFAGHYHNHRDFGNGVYSIGALDHQTWSDVGTKAGWLFVDNKEVEHIESTSPKFVSFDSAVEALKSQDKVDENYVRIKTAEELGSRITKIKQVMEKWGAKGIIINNVAPPKNAVVRTGKAVNVASSAERAIDSFITARYKDPDILTDIRNHSMEIYREAQEAVE